MHPTQKRDSSKLHNLIGPQVKSLREERRWAQSTLITKLQIAGLDVSRISLAEIEAQLASVRDYELLCFALAFDVALKELFPAINRSDPDLPNMVSRYLNSSP